jgi:S1-C subfamily serine protease
MRSITALLIIAFPVFSQAGERPQAVAKSSASLQAAIRAVLEKVRPSVVRIGHGKPPIFLSGIIITNNGLIVTAGHTSCSVGESMEIHMPGDKMVNGTLLAKLKEPDLALVQIAEKEAWPAVDIGRSDTISNRDPLLALGFGDSNLYGPFGSVPPCSVRLGYRLELLPRQQTGLLRTTVQACVGDSGGPLFDLTGSLVGILSRVDSGTSSLYVPSQLLLRTWNKLAGQRPAPARSSASRPRVETFADLTARGIHAVQPSVVEVRGNGRWAAVGAYVGDGFIATKASELGPSVAVVVGKDLEVFARVAASDPHRDLALLQLPAPDFAQGLVAINWADVQDVPVGSLLAAVTPPAFTPPTGIVSVSARTVPPIAGCLPVAVRDANGGVEITDMFDYDLWLPRPPLPLRRGDVITHVAGIPTANRDAFNKLTFAGATLGPHPRVKGEPVPVTCVRQGKTEETMVHLHSQATVFTQLTHPYSYRYSGFAAAIASDLGARPEHCGAPVVDADGRVIGLLIARAPFMESLILPGSEIRSALEAMRKSAKAMK